VGRARGCELGRRSVRGGNLESAKLVSDHVSTPGEGEVGYPRLNAQAVILSVSLLPELDLGILYRGAFQCEGKFYGAAFLLD